MIALVVYACLATQPDTCSPEVVQWADHARMLNCSVESSVQLDEWAKGHPDMIVKDHWCMTDLGQALEEGPATAGRVLPLIACDVRDRATARMWSIRNPGLSAAEECNRLIFK